VNALGPDTKFVTVGIVGNDLQFGNTVHDCIVNSAGGLLAPQFYSTSCQQNQGADADKRLKSLEQGSLHKDLLDLYRLIRAKAPYARVIVVSYPHFFPKNGSTNCGWVLRPSDQVWMNAGIDRADNAIGTVAQEAGFEYVNMADSNAGHEQCTSQEAMNGVTPNLAAPASESYHPNKLGHQLMALRIATKLSAQIVPSFVILPQQTVKKTFTVKGKKFVVNVAWPGSDVMTTLISPSGVRYARDNALDAAHDHGMTWEYYDVAAPEPGDWTVELYGADVAPSGDPVTLDAYSEPEPNHLPSAVMRVAGVGNSYSFDGSASSDDDGTITNYMWDFGDNEVAFGPTAAHTYSKAGTYAVTLVTTDNDGGQGFTTSTRTLTVPDPHAAAIDSSANFTNDLIVRGDARVNGNVDCNTSAIVRGKLIVHGNAHLTNQCHILSDLLVDGNAILDSNAVVDGSVVATGEVRLQSSAHVGGDVRAAAFTSIDERADSYLISHAVVGGTITRNANPTVPTVPPYASYAYSPADWDAYAITSWQSWMNATAKTNSAPSWSPGLSSTPGCVMAPWASSVSGNTVSVATATLVDARLSAGGCGGVALQQMTVSLSANLTLVADKFDAIGGVKFVSADGRDHVVRIYLPGIANCRGGHDLTLQAGTVADPHISLNVLAPGKLTMNGPTTVTGNADAACFVGSGSVSLGNG